MSLFKVNPCVFPRKGKRELISLMLKRKWEKQRGMIWLQTRGVDREIDLLFCPSTEAAYKSQSPPPHLHFLFLSIKNDKPYLLKPLACFRVPVCTFLLNKWVRAAQIYPAPLNHPPPPPYWRMNKRVIRCVGVAATQRPATAAWWSIRFC